MPSAEGRLRRESEKLKWMWTAVVILTMAGLAQAWAARGKQRRNAGEGNARALRRVVVSHGDVHAEEHHVQSDAPPKWRRGIEAAMLPGKLRIDIGPPKDGNGCPLVDGNVTVFKEGQVRPTSGKHAAGAGL